MIGIIGAMDSEVENLKNVIENKKEEKISGIDFVSGKISGRDVVVAKCGIGKVFAALCAEAMILSYKPDIIINTGVAGGLSKNLKIGDIVVSENVVQHDMDTTGLGEPLGFLSGIDIIKIPADKDIAAHLERCIKETGLNYERGIVASGDRFVSDDASKKFIKDNFDAACCEMEGGSIGHVCFVNNVPFCVLRAISDGADDGATVDFPTFVKMAAENSTKVILKFLSTI